MNISLNSDQVNALKDYLNAKHYADGYNYLRDIVDQQRILAEGDPANSQDLYASSAWFAAASHINANDGSFVSEFVRGSTEYVTSSQGWTVTDQQFQDSSDQLAKNLLKQIIDDKSIPSAQELVDEDIKNAVDTLNMPPWGWAGALTDFLPKPFGLRKHVASYPYCKSAIVFDAAEKNKRGQHHNTF